MPTLRDNLASGRDDRGRRNVLVVQGGGMRGVYSMGALAALEESGLSEAFNVIVGSSAGAINGAYLLAGQAKEAVRVYVDLLSNRNFINPWRFWKIVDIDYLVDDVLKRLLPLNVEAVKASRTTLEIILADADTAEPVIISNRSDVDFYELIRATAALPALYNRKVLIDGRYYVDGGVADSVPAAYAAAAAAETGSGSADILAVVTRPPDYRRRDAHPFLQRILALGAIGHSRAVKAVMGREDVRYNDSMDLLQGVTTVDSVRAITVWPSDSARLAGRTTSDKHLLELCADMGRQDMHKMLDTNLAPSPASSR